MKWFDLFKRYDFSFFFTISTIFIIGLANLFSATANSNDLSVAGLYKTQIFWFIVSLFVGVTFSFLRTKTIFRFSWPIYLFNIFLLLSVLLFGTKVMGATRWINMGFFRFQPSEFMKISLLFVLARFFSGDNYFRGVNFKDLIIPALMALVPALLVIKQPDLGTGLVLLFIFAILAFFVGLKWKVIGIMLFLGILISGFSYRFVLKDYQRNRINAFLDPKLELKGIGYNANQSKIAIGSGQFFGKGFQKSSQANLNYLPENHTDFVFSIFNEEHGLFGSIVLICLYLFLFFRFLRLAHSASNPFDSILVIGIMAIFFCHTIINMAMVTGLMPIVGIPLPLMSYGGSNLLTIGICCGIATSISNSRTIF
jgi:rod shape determining protein RodA